MSVACECTACRGTGTVECHECDGSGSVPADVETLSLSPKHPAFEEIQLLKRDANDVRIAATVLTKMKPEHAASYERQLAKALQVIDKNVTEAFKEAVV